MIELWDLYWFLEINHLAGLESISFIQLVVWYMSAIITNPVRKKLGSNGQLDYLANYYSTVAWKCLLSLV